MVAEFIKCITIATRGYVSKVTETHRWRYCQGVIWRRYYQHLCLRGPSAGLWYLPLPRLFVKQYPVTYKNARFPDVRWHRLNCSITPLSAARITDTGVRTLIIEMWKIYLALCWDSLHSSTKMKFAILLCNMIKSYRLITQIKSYRLIAINYTAPTAKRPAPHSTDLLLQRHYL